MPGVRVDEHVGRMLGERYHLEAPVGSGASARVYLAEDVSLRRPVAVKLLHSGLAGDSRFAKRFRNEAQAAAQLAHPRILAVFDWSEQDELYLVTELLAGGSMRHMLDAGHRLSLSQTLIVGLHAAEGLTFAHTQGFVHRDVKPANLLFGLDGRLRIADFGIARAVAEAAWTEPEGSLIGTARYAAPEQASGKTPRGEADVYSLALTLIEAVTGDVPLVGATPLATMVMRQDTDIPVPEEMGPLTEALEAAGKADPAERIGAWDFGRMLNDAAGALPRPRVLPLAGLPSDELGEFSERSLETGSGGPLHPSGDLDLDGLGSKGIDLNGARIPGHTETVMIANGTSIDGTPIHFADDPDGVSPHGKSRQENDGLETDEEALVPDGPAIDEELASLALDNDPDDPQSDYVDFVEGRRRKWPWVLAVLVATAALFAFANGFLNPSDSSGGTDTPVAAGAKVPFFVGEQWDSASGEIVSEGWVPKQEPVREPDSIPGQVLRQRPTEGVFLAEGKTVTLVVSEGLPLASMPDLLGVSIDEARVILADAGLKVGERTASYSDTDPVRAVMTQSYEAGTELEQETEIDLLLSGGPAPRPVPNLLGVDIDSATAKLTELGLAVAVGEGEFSETFAEGLIVRTEPGADVKLEVGSTVTVVLSKGLPFVEVPVLRGLDADVAADLLTKAGFVVEGVVGSPSRPVLITDPPPGEFHRKGTRVTIITRK